MRIARCRYQGDARYGVVRDDRIELIEQAPWGDAKIVATGDVVDLATAELLPPSDPRGIYAIGRNYAEHAKEMGFELPSVPSVFLKPHASLLGNGGTVVLPPTDVSDQVQHEAELVVVIGRRARDVSPEQALDFVAGYTCADDVSARDLQRSDTHVTRAKGYDTFCPVGPWIETELDPSSVPVRCRVNGELRQDGNTSDLIFPVPVVISWISSWSTLLPGDLILTGSPHGTGPLRAGDTVAIEIGGIGTLEHRVAAAP